MASQPLVAMLDFLDEVKVEESELKDVAKVEAWNLSLSQPLPDKVPCLPCPLPTFFVVDNLTLYLNFNYSLKMVFVSAIV